MRRENYSREGKQQGLSMEEKETSVQRISEFSINMWEEDSVRRGNMEIKTVKEEDWS